ncbi:hypothetical protein WJX77_009970 [Trebouxia sp. C0004]
MQSLSVAGCSDVEQLRDILGPSVARRRLRILLQRASGSVQRAVDLHFAADNSPARLATDLFVLGDAETASGSGSRQSNEQAEQPHRRRRDPPRAARQPGTPAWQALADFVELSSSTDNDFDPNASSSSSEEHDEDDDDDGSPEVFAAQPVKDWTSLDFGIVRDLAASKGEHQLGGLQMPLANQRAANGHLFCQKVDDVPDKTVLPLNFPVHFGSLSLPVLEVITSGASTRAECSCKFGVGNNFTDYTTLTRGLLWAISSHMSMRLYTTSKKKDAVHVATVGRIPAAGSALGQLLYHLAELRHEGHIEVKAKLAPGPAHPELVKAADFPEPPVLNKPMHAVVDIFLLEKGILAGGQDASQLKNKKHSRGGKVHSKMPNTWHANARHMAPLLNWMLLTASEGLQIGPDSDGLLNFCDSTTRVSSAVSQPEAEAELLQDAPEGTNGLLVMADHAAEDSQGPSDVQGQSGAAPVTVQQMLDSVALPDDAPRAVAPSALRTVPKQFQLQGLYWMLARERQGDALGRGQLHLHPEWMQLLTADKQLVHYNRLANHFSDTLVAAPVGGTCGGFLCDEMGLGKTLQCLMLILANPAPASWPVVNLEKHNHDKGEAVPIKTTLIVMPANLLQQWQDELSKHVQEGALKWCVYDGKADYLAMSRQQPKKSNRAAVQEPTRVLTRRTRSQRDPAAEGGFVSVVRPIWCLDPSGSPVQMQQQDIALMTYEQLRKELSASNKCPLLQFGFWRVVLDEAQLVAATSSVAAQMTSSLWRRHAWVVTGTPITARLEEIQGLLEFLAYEPFYHSMVWRSLLHGPLEGNHPEGSLPLRNLMQGVMLRRTKAHVGGQLSLPPCEHTDRWVSMSSVERSFYDRLHKQVVSTQAQHQASQKKRRPGGTSRNPTSMAGRLLRQFTELRQCCCHPQIVRTSDSMLGKDRLSMQDIITRLTTKAYMEYDQAARAHVTARLLQEAVALPAAHRPSSAYMEVMQQISAAVESASQLEVAELLDNRASDGSLPIPPVPTGNADAKGPAAAVARLLKRKPVGNGEGVEQGAEGSQLPNAKRQRADEQHLEGQDGTAAGTAPGGVSEYGCDQMQEASQSTAQENRPSSLSQAAGHDPTAAVSRKHDPPGSGVAMASAHQADADVAIPCGPSATGPDLMLPDRDAANRPEQTGPNTTLPDQDAANGPEQPGPVSGLPDQADTSGADQPGPSAPLPYQGQEEEVSHEVKEKKEQARSRSRAWRKVLLDGLDLLAELTAAAAAADDSEHSDLAQDCQVLEEESMQLRMDLGLVPELGLQPEEAPRFSKRARQMAPEMELGADAAVHLSEAHAAHLRAAKLILKAYDDLKSRRSRAAAAASSAVTSTHEAVCNKWRTVQHMYHKQMEVTADLKGKGRAVPNGPAGSHSGGEIVEQGDTNSCPICLDECAARTVTACGHYFCSACIHELVEGGASGEVPCPLCRAPLQSKDLYDAVSEEEAEEARQAASIQGDYGSKVSALLMELAAMKQADPTAKAVVFSSWSRLLRLVEEALQDNTICYTSIAGAQADSRVAALRKFMKEPECSVLTVVMSTGGGAAGLTLTVASHVFLLEPNLNPGLEAQAAARVYRLGQTKPTRIIRLLTEGTIEKSILAHQRKKLQRPGQGQMGVQLQEAELLAGNTLADLLAAHP